MKPKPHAGATIKIVDPETYTVKPEGEEGEIWVDSDCKALGYWEKEEKSQRIFEAQLDEISDYTYLRTGDLGFMKDGNLFVSGRLKNLIIIHGRKIHPSDIETKIESSFTMLQPGRSVACGYTVKQFRDAQRFKGIAYVAELRSPKSHSLEELHLLSQHISTLIGLNFHVEAHLVVFIHPHSMPCTTSGKCRRSICRKKLVKNALNEVYCWSRDMKADTRVNKPSTPRHKMVQSTTAAPMTTSGVSSIKSVLTGGQEPSPQIEINILEPSDSETEGASLEFNGKHTCTELESDELRMVREDTATVKMLEVKPPDIVRTERRKSAPALSVDRQSQVKAGTATRMKRSSSHSKIHTRRNNLQTITDTVSRVLGVAMQPDSNIWTHGCNSVKVVQLSQCLQSEFGFAVKPHHLFIHKTPKALLHKLQRSLLSMSSPLIVSNQSNIPLAVVEKRSIAIETELDTVHEEVHEEVHKGEDMVIEQGLANNEKEASKYLQDHKIIELLQYLVGLLVYETPADPKEYMNHMHQLLKGKSDPDKAEPPCLLDESNLKSIYHMLDITKKGCISKEQYLQAMGILRVRKFKENPAGADLNKVTLETFLRETKAALN